jgi:hypothetical protein
MSKASSMAGKGAKRVEKGLTKASQRVARAVELGLVSWRKQRDKSSKRRLNGAIRDAFRNSVFAAGKAAKEASWGSSDFIGALGRRQDPRRIILRAILPL